MTIIVNRRSGNDSSAYAYLIQFNISSGNVEFTSSSGTPFTRPLIKRPYLDRWYHITVTRDSGGNFKGYLDGREIQDFAGNAAIGTSTDGVSIGGWNASGSAGRYFFGDIQEVAVHQSALSAPQVRAFMFTDLPVTNLASTLRGYFKLSSSTNAANLYRNFALNPPGDATAGQPAGSGVVQFEETDLAGEQSLFDSRKNGAAEALVPLSGGFVWQQTVLARPTPGIAFDWRFGYSSANTALAVNLGEFDPFEAQELGSGWRHSFEARILPEGGLSEVRLLQWDGSIETWLQTTNNASGTHYRTRHREYRGELLRLVNGEFQWTTPERLVHHFRNPFPSEFDPPTEDPFLLKKGFLETIRDFNGNSVEVSRDVLGKIDRVTDSARGSYVFSYTNNLIAAVTFGPWVARFTYDSTNRIASRSITNTAGIYSNLNTSWQFAYSPSNGLLQAIIDPRGNTNMLVHYDKYGRKTNEIDALGRSTQTRYGVPGRRQITHLDPATNSWVESYDRKGRVLTNQDPLLNLTRYTYDDRGNRTSIIEPLGWTNTFGYDERANVIARTNALNEVTLWNFHLFFNKPVAEINPLHWTNTYVLDNTTGNLLRHFDDLGTLVSYAYASNGLVLTSTDANTNTTRFAYDTNGFLISRTDPATNTTTFEYNDVGWKTSEIDPLYNWTDFNYDLNGNVVAVTDPIFRRFHKTYDANGNLIAASDGMGRFITNIYDVANQKVATIDRTGTNITRFAYTSRGKLERTTNPLNHVTSSHYDAANRLTNVTDTLGNATAKEYDANGNETAMIDPVGQRWTKTYDRLNRVIAESNPQGDTRRTTFDAAGRIHQVFTPLDYPSTHAYDGRGRLTNWVDAEGFSWRYTYDGNANIIDIEDALHGHYVMEYGPRNERTLERNQDTNTWRYAYDELLRLKEQRDPNGTIRTMRYDDVSRVDEVIFNTGRWHTFDYDDNNNVKVVSRRDGGATAAVPTRFRYDVLDRPIEQSDVHRQTVNYGYDAIGRIALVTYPGGKTLVQNFDSLNRLTNQIFNFGPQTFATSYGYDKASRLVQRAYPNGVVQSNAFDTAGRITGLSYVPSAINSNAINIALTYAYDRNGNKNGGSEKGTFEYPLPLLTDDIVNFTAAGKLKTRTTQTNAPGAFPSPGGEGQGEGGLWSYSYDPSGNMTNATISGPASQSYALTYDEDNRTTSIRWTTNAQTTTVSNRYDALGRRVSRTLNGSRTDYVLDLSGSMERILCDLDAAGTITAWYIHGPDLAFKVSADGALACYHADSQANVIALSGTNGTPLAQYAFTPYGRTLGSVSISNLQSQIPNPFTFVGSQGVMEELPGLYFMRARYYSAEAGVFFSTDPVKKIGPRWKPEAYVYGGANPNRFIDPQGTDKTENIIFSGLVFISGLIVEEATGIIDKLDRTAEHIRSQVEYGSGIISEDEHAKYVLADQELIDEQVQNGMASGSRLLTKVYRVSLGIVNWAMSEPISANGGTVGNSTPMFAGNYAESLSDQVRKPASATREINRLNNRIDSYRDKIADLDKRIRRLRDMDELSKSQRERLKKYKQDREKYRDRLNDAKADLKELKR